MRSAAFFNRTEIGSTIMAATTTCTTFPGMDFTGIVVVLFTTIAKGKYLPWITAAGYGLGFIFAYIFQKDGFDPGGGSINDLWAKWMLAYTCITVAGIIIEVVMRIKNKKLKS